MALTPTSPASSSDFWLKSKRHTLVCCNLWTRISTQQGFGRMTHTSRQREGSCDWSASYPCRREIKADRHTMKEGGETDTPRSSAPEAGEDLISWFSEHLVPMRTRRCHASRHLGNRGLRLPWLCGEWKESPPPPLLGLACQPDSVPSLRPASPPFSFKAAKYLIALTDVGLFIQCRLRGSSKEREAEVSENKSNTDPRGGGTKQRASWEHYLQPQWCYDKRRRWGISKKPQAYTKGRTPLLPEDPFSSQPGSRGWDLTNDKQDS